MRKYRFIDEGFNKSFPSKEAAMLYIADKRPANDEYFTLECSVVTTTKIKSKLPKISNNNKLVIKLFDNIIKIIDYKINLPQENFCKIDIDCARYGVGGNWNSLDYYTPQYEKVLYEFKNIRNYIKSFDFNSNIAKHIKVYNIITDYKPCNNICICLPYYFINCLNKKEIRYFYFQFRKNNIMIDSSCYTGHNVNLRNSKLIEFNEEIFDECDKLILKMLVKCTVDLLT